MSEKRPIFVIDSMLGNLAKKLRILGYDSTFYSDIEDEKLVIIAKNEKRVLVTKDEQLTKSADKQGIMTILIRGNDELEQIAQINAKIRLKKIPEGILEREEKFWMCESCKKIYWKGTHFKKLQEFADKLNNRLQ